MLVNENKKGSLRFFLRIYRLWNKFRDRFAGALAVGNERKKDLYIQLSRAATLKDLVYWLQILFSAGIATLGLVLNSPAVIIGAMLISPLMNPIMASGLSLATGDLILGIRAVLSLFFSSVVSIGFAFLLVAFLPFKEQTPEILARTSPNTLDLGIALFSGAIGSVATCREVKGAVTSIPGVAIAVALMPPLCVVGYGLGLAVTLNFNDGLNIARGGGLLYLTNLVAITFTAMIVFVLLRIDTSKVRQSILEWRDNDGESKWLCRVVDKIPTLEHAREIRSFSIRLFMILIPMLLIFIPLTQSFNRLRAEIAQKQSENQIQQKARSLWSQFYENGQDGQTRSFVDDLRIKDNDGKLEVYLRVFDNVPYTPEEKREFVRLLASHLNRPVDSISLQLVEVPTSARQSLVPKTAATPLPPTISELQAGYLKAVENALTGLSFPAPAQMLDYRIISRPYNDPSVQLFYMSDREISGDALDLIARDVKSRLNLPNASVSFERIPVETQKIPFETETANFNFINGNFWREAGRYLQNHSGLRLAVWLKSPETERQEKLKAEKQMAVKQFLWQNWGIDEKRIIFNETKDENEADNFRIMLE